jgi:dolichol-phosphate mannosyltransferase
MDADLQDPPELIPSMLRQWRQGSDVVHTVRTKRHGENRFKMWLTHQAYRVLAVGSEIKLPVDAGDYKLLSRNAVSHLIRFRESEPYVRGLIVWIGFKQTSLEYEREPRAAGFGQRGLFSTAPYKVFLAGMTSFSFVPIYTFLVIGTLGLALSLLLTAGAAILALAGTVLGWRYWLGFFGLFCWASIVAGLGMVGVYVSRIYKDIRRRPHYIVQDAVGFEAAALHRVS